jgi:hypothetical protein
MEIDNRIGQLERDLKALKESLAKVPSKSDIKSEIDAELLAQQTVSRMELTQQTERIGYECSSS